MTRDEYYDLLCDCADQLGTPGPTDILGHPLEHEHVGGGCGGGGCSCCSVYGICRRVKKY